jgi:hypothetical protein
MAMANKLVSTVTSQIVINPSSFAYQVERLLGQPGWNEAADTIYRWCLGLDVWSPANCGPAKTSGVIALSCSVYAAAVIQNLSEEIQ